MGNSAVVIHKVDKSAREYVGSMINDMFDGTTNMVNRTCVLYIADVTTVNDLNRTSLINLDTRRCPVRASTLTRTPYNLTLRTNMDEPVPIHDVDNDIDVNLKNTLHVDDMTATDNIHKCHVINNYMATCRDMNRMPISWSFLAWLRIWNIPGFASYFNNIRYPWKQPCISIIIRICFWDFNF